MIKVCHDIGVLDKVVAEPSSVSATLNNVKADGRHDIAHPATVPNSTNLIRVICVDPWFSLQISYQSVDILP